jgi:hypothetical protein
MDCILLFLPADDNVRSQYLFSFEETARPNIKEGHPSPVPQGRFNRNTHNDVKFPSPRLCGIGFRGLYTEQSLIQQSMLLKHLRIPGQPQHLYLIFLAWAQLASGIGFPLLEFPDLPVTTLEDAFLQSIRQGMVHTGSSLRLHLSLVRPLAR